MGEPRSQEELRRLSSSELRALLRGRGASDAGCVEKEDFVKAAARALGLDGAGDAAPGALDLNAALEDDLSVASDLNRSPTPSRSSSSSRSRRSGSPERLSEEGPPADFGVEHMRLGADDVAQLSFSRFPEKISRVSGCHCVLKELILELKGSTVQRRRAR
ncbi:unnamed protein product, partial [Prorocentrum cordatum]